MMWNLSWVFLSSHVARPNEHWLTYWHVLTRNHNPLKILSPSSIGTRLTWMSVKSLRLFTKENQQLSALCPKFVYQNFDDRINTVVAASGTMAVMVLSPLFGLRRCAKLPCQRSQAHLQINCQSWSCMRSLVLTGHGHEQHICKTYFQYLCQWKTVTKCIKVRDK